MNFFRRVDQEWKIERRCVGRYLNSPPVWRCCGYARARTRSLALRRAEEIVGCGTVRVCPMEASR